MSYYVISDDGSKYGPAEVGTLNQWIQEGRLLPSTLLEDDASGTRIAASAVPGLNFPPAAAAAPSGPPPGGGVSPGANTNPYANAGPGMGSAHSARFATQPTSSGNEGSGVLIASWVFGVLGLICCGFIGAGIGLACGFAAKGKGNSGAQAAIIFNAVVLVLSIILMVVLLPSMLQRINAAGTPQGVQPIPTTAPGR